MPVTVSREQSSGWQLEISSVESHLFVCNPSLGEACAFPRVDYFIILEDVN